MQFMIADFTSVRIYEDMDTYDNDPNATPDYSMPTIDFVVIVQAWRDYLNESPHKLGE